MDIQEVIQQTNLFIERFKKLDIKSNLYDELLTLSKALSYDLTEDRKVVLFLLAQDVFRDATDILNNDHKIVV